MTIQKQKTTKAPYSYLIMFRNKQQLSGMHFISYPINCNLYAYAANNPVKYTDPDGREEIDYHSLQTINEVARYRSNVNTCDSYIQETLRIQNQIGNINQKIGSLKNEIFDLKLEYKKQQINDMLNIINVLGTAANNAKKQAYDLRSFGFAMLLNLDPETVAETYSDYLNSNRITRMDLILLESNNKKEIHVLEREVRGLEAELKSFEVEITRMKNEMKGKKEYWESD